MEEGEEDMEEEEISEEEEVYKNIHKYNRPTNMG